MLFITRVKQRKRSKDRKINGRCTNGTNRRSRVWPFFFIYIELTILTWSSSAAAKSSKYSSDNISPWTQVFRDSASFPKLRDFLDEIIFSGDLTRWDFTLGDPLFRSGERRLTPSPYCLFCHSFAVFLPFASVWKRKGNGCYAGYLSDDKFIAGSSISY